LGPFLGPELKKKCIDLLVSGVRNEAVCVGREVKTKGKRESLGVYQGQRGGGQDRTEKQRDRKKKERRRKR